MTGGALGNMAGGGGFVVAAPVTVVSFVASVVQYYLSNEANY